MKAATPDVANKEQCWRRLRSRPSMRLGGRCLCQEWSQPTGLRYLRRWSRAARQPQEAGRETEPQGAGGERFGTLSRDTRGGRQEEYGRKDTRALLRAEVQRSSGVACATRRACSLRPFSPFPENRQVHWARAHARGTRHHDTSVAHTREHTHTHSGEQRSGADHSVAIATTCSLSALDRSTYLFFLVCRGPVPDVLRRSVRTPTMSSSTSSGMRIPDFFRCCPRMSCPAAGAAADSLERWWGTGNKRHTLQQARLQRTQW